MLRDVIAMDISTALRWIATSVASLIVGLSLGWQLGLVTIAFVPALAIAGHVMTKVHIIVHTRFLRPMSN